jgi:hypothetical protein
MFYFKKKRSEEKERESLGYQITQESNFEKTNEDKKQLSCRTRRRSDDGYEVGRKIK